MKLEEIGGLEELGFEEIGFWEENDGLTYRINNDVKEKWVNHPNILYAFVTTIVGEEDSEVSYIGKTTKTLRTRFSGYKKPGRDQQTNARVHNAIQNALNENRSVCIYVFKDVVPLQWGGFNLNVAAGIEDDLIRRIAPAWNKAGISKKATSDFEAIENASFGTDEDWSVSFEVTLRNTYYNSPQGFMNPGTKASQSLGLNGDSVTLKLNSEITLNGVINRTANNNGSVRITWGSDLRDFYQSKYSIGDVVVFVIKPGNVIEWVK